MSKAGFYIRELSVQGERAETASVNFDPEFSLVVGASDTGKSYILQCIDFLLGAGKPPKVIPESSGYERARLAVTVRSTNLSVAIERSLRGGALKLFDGGANTPRTVRDKHSEGPDRSISGYLLATFGVNDRRIRNNERGSTQSVTFRDFGRLAIIDEETMFAERSPALSGQYTSKTAERSMFRFLMTGVDDSSVVEQPKPEIVRATVRAQTELLTVIEGGIAKELAAFGVPREQIEADLKRVSEEFDTLLKVVVADQASVAAVEQERRKAWSTWRGLETRRVVLEGLIARFALLERHYASDIRRLEASAEADYLFEQYPNEACPVCGAPAAEQPHRHTPNNAEFQNACIAEAQKLRAMATDLASTLKATRTELETVTKKAQAARADVDRIAARLKADIEPKARASAEALRNLQQSRERFARAQELANQLASISARKAGVVAPAPGPPPSEGGDEPQGGVPAHNIEHFCLEVEHILREWQFPGLTRVVFSEEAFDIVVSGRPRASHGKGVRAILHAAFVLGLMRYCARYDRPHPGVVVLDSPLVAYREPETAGDLQLGPAVKAAFYRSLTKNIAMGQVIVLENEEPPNDVGGHPGVTRFTKSGSGRYGFFPVPRT